jgi:hypothetical protein
MPGSMMRTGHVMALVGVVIAAAGAAAHAQIVNVQGALARPPENNATTGQLELKGSWREGNNPIFDVGGGGSVVVRRGRVIGLVLARGEYGTSRGVVLTKKTFEHARLRVEFDGPWCREVFAQHEYDQFRRLSLRAVTGTGPAVQLVETKPIGVLAGAAYLYEYEELDTRPGTIDAGERLTAHRASVYVTGHENAGGGVAVVETVYAQPRLNRSRDVRVLGELAVQSKLSSRLALKNSFTIAYDHTPPDGVERLDTSLEVSVQLTL